jgi:Na+-translocating ferredoxin:NAD+ oxidoreductase RNF subunit RnfB
MAATAVLTGALTVVLAVASMVFLGVVFGIGLSMAARKFAVHEDERLQRALSVLPGVNCGGCGFAGCHSYAEAVVQGEKVSLCTVGGPDVARALAEMMGVEVGEMVRLRAVVHCKGGTDKCSDRFIYVGEDDCRAAHLASGGPKACAYGCLGLSSCAKACPFGAITMSQTRLPVVDADKCIACGICVRTCPRDLISLLAVDYKVYLGCSSHDRGKDVKDICSTGCISCGLCVKNDPFQATQLVNNLPVLDFEKAGGDFRKGAEVCPTNAFVVEEGVLAAAAPAAEQEAQTA